MNIKSVENAGFLILKCDDKNCDDAIESVVRRFVA